LELAIVVPILAVIVALPLPTAVANPEDVMVITFTSLDSHATEVVMSLVVAG
jgi:hypothetical protein